MNTTNLPNPSGRPYGPKKHKVPFVIIDHDIAADSRLTPTDLRVLAALLYYARQDSSCWPSDASLGSRIHRHPCTIRRSLKRLEDLEYIKREFFPSTASNPVGRIIHLLFTFPDWTGPEGCRQLQPTRYTSTQYNEEYLQSDHWKAVRLRTLQSDGYACRICNRKDKLQVHHRSYDRLGAELPPDVITLCDDCHTIFHENSHTTPQD